MKGIEKGRRKGKRWVIFVEKQVGKTEKGYSHFAASLYDLTIPLINVTSDLHTSSFNISHKKPTQNPNHIYTKYTPFVFVCKNLRSHTQPRSINIIC